MAGKAKSAPRPAAAAARTRPYDSISLAPPLTTEERVHRIEALGKRIDSYIAFMVQIGTQAGSSAEVKERAVLAFYSQMVLVESQLAKIHDELRLE